MQNEQAFLIEVFDEKRSGNLCKRRVSLDVCSAVDWMNVFAKDHDCVLQESTNGFYSVYQMIQNGEHIFTGKVTNIALV